MNYFQSHYIRSLFILLILPNPEFNPLIPLRGRSGPPSVQVAPSGAAAAAAPFTPTTWDRTTEALFAC